MQFPIFACADSTKNNHWCFFFKLESSLLYHERSRSLKYYVSVIWYMFKIELNKRLNVNIFQVACTCTWHKVKVILWLLLRLLHDGQLRTFIYQSDRALHCRLYNPPQNLICRICSELWWRRWTASISLLVSRIKPDYIYSQMGAVLGVNLLKHIHVEKKPKLRKTFYPGTVHVNGWCVWWNRFYLCFCVNL